MKNAMTWGKLLGAAAIISLTTVGCGNNETNEVDGTPDSIDSPVMDTQDDQAITGGDTNEGATTEGATTEGATTEGATTEGATTEGATTEGATTEGATTEGATTDQATEGSDSTAPFDSDAVENPAAPATE